MSKRKTTEQFITEAKAIWGDLYGYERSDYKGANIPVEVKCSKHDFFSIRPIDHLHGHGCPKCAHEINGKRCRTPFEVFHNKAISIYGDMFIYDKDSYIGMDAKMNIFCVKHKRWFSQKPINHLAKNGCSLCVNESSKILIFGVAVNDLFHESKTNQIHTKSYSVWRNLLCRTVSPTNQRRERYKDCTICPEWLTFSKFKEWFDNNYIEGCELDKDIIVPNNRHYSPETCCFVPSEINKLFTKRVNKHSELPLGVHRNNDGYRATVRHNGKVLACKTFPTIQEAESFYLKNKKKMIEDIAVEYFKNGKITQRVFKAIMDYPCSELRNMYVLGKEV